MLIVSNCFADPEFNLFLSTLIIFNQKLVGPADVTARSFVSRKKCWANKIEQRSCFEVYTQANLILNKLATEKNLFFYLFGSLPVYFVVGSFCSHKKSCHYLQKKNARVVLLFILIAVRTGLTTLVMDVCSSPGWETKTEKQKPEQNLLTSPQQQ